MINSILVFSFGAACASGNKTSLIKFEKFIFFPDNSGVRAEMWTVEKEKLITR
jgi:hypothetical protein